MKYLTKSLFSIAISCPTKLFYKGKDKYSDNSIEDTFLEALAKGGFQVGELARCYYPSGSLIEDKDYHQSLEKTDNLLKREKATIFEAAFKHSNLFVRTDIIVKNNNSIDLIEVKSKSYDETEDTFFNKNGSISAGWKPYIYDVAFQKYVVNKAYPDLKVNAFLFLADKNSNSSVDGLNQKFCIEKDNGRFSVKRNGDVSLNALGDKILKLVNVDNVIDNVWSDGENQDLMNMNFSDYIEFLSTNYVKDNKINTSIGKKCKTCEFKISKEKSNGKLGGFDECWQTIFTKYKDESEESLLYNIWNFRDVDKNFEQGRYFISELDKTSFDEKKKTTGPGLTSKQRQKLQYEYAISSSSDKYIDNDGLKNEMQTWKFPLHMIDFETSIVAIPFNKGRRPYELIAFQFSHHTIDKNGNIKHVGQYINAEQGKFPNFEFLIELKNQLDNDDGTIFRYAAHEKTVLTSIQKELEEIDDNDFPNKTDYINWISEVTTGNRAMVDMLELVKKYYYSPLMKGSNSLKVVLPAILNESKYLQNKYNKPIYASKEFPSLNYNEPIAWIKEINGKISDPYKLLPKLEYDITEKEEQLLFEGSGISEGGSAMIAYNLMQFTSMSVAEREALKNILLKYCELDTFAMVLLWEYFNNEC
ncbi:MAG: DUF2779 domain-containing protein [Ignavibacteria bacterium]|nr:DUF2779 domain-containing protein [Ignavibacteria bacterium]